MTVEETKAKAAKCVSEYQGKTYFFCNARCKKGFDEAPEVLDGQVGPETFVVIWSA